MRERILQRYLVSDYPSPAITSRDLSLTIRCKFPDGQVSWTDWTAGDGQKTGGDADGVWYVADAISLYLKRFPLSGKRTGVFWAGGATTEDDFETVDEFLEINLNFGAQKADTVYSNQDFLDMNLNEANKATDQKWWRAINRMSKGTFGRKSSPERS